METTQISTDRYMDKENVLYTYNGRKSLKQESPAICDMDETRHNAK